jgi:hypothetical protein
MAVGHRHYPQVPYAKAPFAYIWRGKEVLERIGAS